MSTLPSYMTEEPKPSMWSSTGPSVESATQEGKEVKRKYFRDVQFVFSRVQHHVLNNVYNNYVC